MLAQLQIAHMLAQAQIAHTRMHVHKCKQQTWPSAPSLPTPPLADELEDMTYQQWQPMPYEPEPVDHLHNRVGVHGVRFRIETSTRCKIWGLDGNEPY